MATTNLATTVAPRVITLSPPPLCQGKPVIMVAKRQSQVGIAETLGMLLKLAIGIKLYRS
jgi:hypothetical protein